MFVLIPILFGLQQASEGIVWVTMGQPDSSSLFHFAVLAFLFCALIFWPSWIPWSLRQLEVEKPRRKVMFALGALGITGSLYSCWLLFTGAPNAEILGHCVVYTFPAWKAPIPSVFYILGYTLPTIVPFLISSLRLAKVTGWLFLIGLILTFFIREQALTSVWCFSASVISFFITLDVIAERWPRAAHFCRTFSQPW